MLKHVLIAIVALTFIGSSHAANIGNFPPNQSGGSDLNATLLADRFTLATSSFITQITYWTLQDNLASYAGSTTVNIYGDTGGHPGSLLFGGPVVFTPTATGVSALGLIEYRYTASFLSSLLGAGNYWLGLHNGPVATLPDTSYFWEWQSDTGISQYQDLAAHNNTWVGNDAALAFLLVTRAVSTVPEPASLALLGVGLLAMYRTRRRGASKL